MCQCNGNASASYVPCRLPGSSPCFRDFNTNTVFPNPPDFTSTLSLERWEHCHSLSAHLSCHSRKDQENMPWDCTKPPPLITLIQVSGGSQASCYMRQELSMCFPRSSLSRPQHSLQCCTNIQPNIPEACIRCTFSWISELDFLYQSSMETEKSH